MALELVVTNGRTEAEAWLRRLRALAAEGAVVPVPHAHQRMLERGITLRQLVRCLRHGRVSEGPARESSGRMRAALEMVDSGDTLRVVAEIHRHNGEYVAVITVIRVGN